MINRLESVRNASRLGALRELGLLDTLPEEAFDRLTRLASKALRSPTALFSLVDADREFLKSGVGIPQPWASRRAFPLTHSLCWLVVATGEPLTVADARQHPLVADSPAVRDVGVIAYLGVPITAAGGHVVGTLCVIDQQPRDWTDEDAQVLSELATLVTAEISHRGAATELERQRAAALEGGRKGSLLESIGDGVYGLDRDGTCTFVNGTGAALLGYRPDELLGRPLHQLVHHSYPDGSFYDASECPIVGALTTGQVCRVERDLFWRRDLSSVGVSTACFPIVAEGGVRGATLVLIDSTARRRVEDERERLLWRDRSERIEAEADLRRLAFLAQVSAFVGRSLDDSAVLAALASLAVPYLADWCAVDVMHGGSLQRRAAVHQDPSKTSLIWELPVRFPPDPNATHGVGKVLATGQTELIEELTDREALALASDAEHLQLLRAVGCRSFICAPLIAKGQPFGAISLVRGETSRQYRSSDLGLVEDVARRVSAALDNARLYQESREALDERNEFLMGVSHDLRNPLANIKGFAQLLLRNVRQLRVPEADEMASWLGKIDATTAKMTALTEDLLDLARLQTGQPLELDRRQTNFSALAHQVADVYQQTSERHRITFDATVQNLTGFWDGRRLERVLGNLLANAIKYSPAGGDVSVSVASEEAAGRPWAILTIRDNGVGIPAGDLPHVFERFYRARNVAGQTVGAGVGLASARQIVEQHGGTILVTSEEGRGTAVTIRLPLA
ncbi:MAG TPA: GAF domain-containing protein [Chloroflexota bacterium]|nr:GAF domain-containing protein [Chloroflexota bacterium]